MKDSIIEDALPRHATVSRDTSIKDLYGFAGLTFQPSSFIANFFPGANEFGAILRARAGARVFHFKTRMGKVIRSFGPSHLFSKQGWMDFGIAQRFERCWLSYPVPNLKKM